MVGPWHKITNLCSWREWNSAPAFPKPLFVITNQLFSSWNSSLEVGLISESYMLGITVTLHIFHHCWCYTTFSDPSYMLTRGLAVLDSLTSLLSTIPDITYLNLSHKLKPKPKVRRLISKTKEVNTYSVPLGNNIWWLTKNGVTPH